ncbi:MBL fold metallo-hydrolase [Gordonia sp. SID5947]|uniref:MBL fold metallo-hydrolase n=1 Tax=Gordonia sp. SID5947 TaxID=2690315 RepID=UPI00136AFA53|nr:MBL fold metallo-hydrolase [Gordonia sp. SID5947]MYR07999.1 MBL fold metallo-hydrolase [Gordonia sp. SID5947]
MAPNATWWSYEGTNTWIVGSESTGSDCLVVDPGSAEAAHLSAIVQAADDHGWTIKWVSVTHDHEDHLDGAAELAAMTGARLLTFEGTGVADPVLDGDRIPLGDIEVEVIHTPGHSDDSISFSIVGTDCLLTGDTLLNGRPSAVYGRLDDYMRTLDVLHSLSAGRDAIFLPGHGPVIDEPTSALADARARRQHRIDQVKELNRRGITTVDEILAALYPGIDDEKRFDAEVYVRSIIRYVAADAIRGN